MTIKRGDISLVPVPFAAGTGTKTRPVLVVQNDHYNRRLNNTVVAVITSTLHRVGEPTQFLIDISTPEGLQSGLIHTSVVSCENLHTIRQGNIRVIIGALPDAAMREIDRCLKVALDL